MQQVFISPAEIYSPRWQEAFPAAQVLPSLSPTLGGVQVWLVLQGQDWPKLLNNYLKRHNQVIALTQAETPGEAKQAIAAGASGYVHYLAVPSVLQQVAEVVSFGGMWLGADLMRQLLLPLQGTATAEARHLARLTPREKAVVDAVIAGKTNKEVARLLNITERTVKAHLGAIFEKLAVRDRLQLVLLVTGQR